MITADADFLAAEALKFTAEPVFYFTFTPHYFDSGVGDGMGTFADVTFVGPNRLQVDEGAGSASWTSPVLDANLSAYPITVTPSWNEDYPGFQRAIEYRTATSEALLAAAPYVALIEGSDISLYRYYQWRISWFAQRSWAYNTLVEAETSGDSAWALDTNDPTDEFQSYATDTAGSSTGTTYIENFKLLGIFEIPVEDIMDPGASIDECSTEMGELVAGDHSLTLLNRTGKYSPSHEDFVFARQDNWMKKTLRIEMAYRLLSGKVTSRIIIYEGTIQGWGPTPHRVSERAKMEEHTVTVQSRDVMADIMEQKIGTPNDDGTANPLVFGSVFRQADQLADETLGDADAETGFESGDTSGLTGVDTGGSGTVTVDAAAAYEGSYGLITEIANAAAYAKGRLDLSATSSDVLFCCQVKFETIPGTPADKNMHFMGLYNLAGAEILQLFVGSDYRVHAYDGSTYKETDWYVNQDVGVYKAVSIGVLGANPGTIKIWVNGNEVLTWDEDWAAMSINGAFVGPHNGATAEGWTIHSDSWKIFSDFYPQLFKVWGGPFDSIGTIYIDGAVKMEAEFALKRGRRRLRYSSPKFAARFVGGKTKSANLVKYPEYGAVAFSDYGDQIGGTVMMNLVKDDTDHPVDVIEGILTAAGKDALIDTASFAAAKAARPDDSIGAFFEDCTIADAIKAVASTCLLDVYRSQNLIKLRAYDATAPVSADAELDASEIVGTDPVTETNLKNKIMAKWGWYQRNPRLSYIAEDEESVELQGLYETELDLSHGGMVATDNGEMAKRNADLLLARLKGGMLVLGNTSTSLRMARLEPGDTVEVDLPYLGNPVILTVAKKTIRYATPRGVDLDLIKFLGE